MTVWRTARACNNGECVEVAATATGVAIRDGKNPTGPVLTYGRREFAVFVEGVRRGDFDDLIEPRGSGL